MNFCTRCGYPVHDYCDRCHDPLCPECMKAGCCGVAPATSGVDADFADNLESVRNAVHGDLGLPKEEVTCR